jgi:hypothetical protein
MDLYQAPSAGFATKVALEGQGSSAVRFLWFVGGYRDLL